MTLLPRLQADLNLANERFLRRRSRRRRAAGGLAAVAVIATIAAPFLASDSKDATGPAGLLEVAAARAAEMPASSFGGFTMRGTQSIMSVGVDRPFNVLVPYTTTVTPAANGTYHVHTAATGPMRFLGSASRANFEASHRGKERTSDFYVPASNKRVDAGWYLGVYGERKRVPTVVGVRREMQDLERRSAWSGPARTGPGPSLAPNGRRSGLDLLMPYVQALLAAPTAPTDVRAAVFETLQSMDGVHVVADAKDDDGRSGVGIVRDFDDGQGLVVRTTIVYDPDTTRVLGSRRQVVENDQRINPGLTNPGLRSGDVIGYSTYHYAG